MQDSREVLSWVCAGPALLLQTDLSAGDTGQGRQRCFATHRMICLLFKSVPWISFATVSHGQHSLQSYFMGLAESQGRDTKGGWESVVPAGDVSKPPEQNLIHAAEPFPSSRHPVAPGKL